MFANKEGQKIPNVVFKTMLNGVWKDVSTDEVFNNKTVIVFSLPGAFTPTCSSSHVPRYNELFKVFKANGVDSIVCMSVNDTFVMNAWKENQKAENISFIPDGNGEFTNKMGLLVSKEDIGFGNRSWRYSMLVKNGIIEKQFIEPNKPGDPFEVSDADSMLKYISPNAKLPEEFSLMTKPGCPHCAKAKDLLQSKGIAYEEIVLGTDASMQSLRAITGKDTVPQIYVDGKHIGGCDELELYFK